MKKQNNRFIPENKLTQLSRGISFASAFLGTTLIASSVVQASDLQIYATPTAGKKTIVMMLDTSGSMNPESNSYRENRLQLMKTGMNAFLSSNNPILRDVKVGLGNYSTGGDGKSGNILVAAAPLGDVSTLNTVGSQRYKLKQAVNGLTARNGTPTAHAYAEAAAYLMGTSTRSEAEIEKDLYKKITTTAQVFDRYECQSTSYPYLKPGTNICYQNAGFTSSRTQTATTINKTVNTDTYYQCISWRTTDFTNGLQYCGTGTSNQHTSTNSAYWKNLGNVEPANFSGDGTSSSTGVIYSYKLDMQLGPNADSGFDVSTTDAKDGLKYISPLPVEKDRVSCDGQGVYILSDGAANSTTTNRTKSIMSAALDNYGTGFSCSGGMADAYDDTGRAIGAWDCMGEFAKKLFDKTKNPTGVSIQTAFVGFGSDMNNLNQAYVQRACQLSSRSQADRTGDDACSPGKGRYAVTSPAFGNGGFFTTQSAQGVTDSVIAFINNLGKAPLEPLTTGAISVPVDNLNPSGLQPYGYLRGLEPNPQGTDLAWAGNLKKYQVIQKGNNAGAFAAANGTTLVYDAQGGFNTGTKDLWNNNSVYNGKSYSDGGVIRLGGAYSKVPMPILGQQEDLTLDPPQYAYAANVNAVRNLFTDVSATDAKNLTNASNNTSLLKIPGEAIPTSGAASFVLSQFKTQVALKDFPILTKIKLLNYLGYSIPYDETATALPNTLETPVAPHLAMGGSIHSLPVQLTYSGTLDETGTLTNTRSQSVLYGTMDGGLHIVDSQTGQEQMVFVPAELLRSNLGSKALIKGQTDLNSPVSGTDGAWVADSTYKTQRAASSTETSTVKALTMNIYGGMRMGGNSYYGLDVLNPTSPKLLFRLGADVAGFNRMGQSWSKPVLANIRYQGKNRRVMIVGGGYDQCYENPRFSLNTKVSDTDFPDTSCDNKSQAQGNAVYMVDADDGSLIWSTTYSAKAADGDQKYLLHSVVSRIGAIDRDGDGLIDNLYFGDLGGQVFRADFDNYQTKTGSAYSSFGVRVARIANLASNDTANNTWDYTNSKAPRFYEAPTLTIHDEGANTFLVVGLASGNRSTPLDVVPTVGREKLLPSTALGDRSVNNVYGLIDRDFINPALMKSTTSLKTVGMTLNKLQQNPQLLTGQVSNTFFGSGSGIKEGWYRSLSSMSNGTERGGTGFRVAGGMKAYEEPFAITGNLIIPVYDPQGTGIAGQDPCKPRVVGETDRQLYCLPFGACLKTDGTVDSGPGGRESKTGFQTKTTDCPPGIAECNKNPIGSGIRGLAMAPIEGGACPDKTLAGNDKGTGKWSCEQIINPTRWYDKWIK
ncbi:PilC/PilY family type IV pilus protein [Acinetobacter sp. ANC 4648]|uniref:PilC/PilY family type IV pilus protein n=1 Tax=Acinetobacter sp. ANC 4648 TaxID=1977875 RepID=UPI000A333E57|nr:PilC/PilY family type IV pilus protein [Acinetobacter sp. ANC 4648]OTG80688.1 pilus assembly protein PilY [Acinetobacter sp. ANC 4648]